MKNFVVKGYRNVLVVGDCLAGNEWFRGSKIHDAALIEIFLQTTIELNFIFFLNVIFLWICAKVIKKDRFK